MDFKKMKYFLTVVETQNFTKAAKNLFVAQSSLSEQIKRIEEELQCTLFLRNKKNIKVTKEGMEFYEYCKNTLAEYDAFLQSLNSQNNPIKLGLYYTPKIDQWTKIINDYNQQNEMNIQSLLFYSNDMKKNLLKGDLDIGLSIKDDELLKRGFSYSYFSVSRLSLYSQKQLHHLDRVCIYCLDSSKSSQLFLIYKEFIKDYKLKENNIRYLNSLEEILFALNYDNTAALLLDSLVSNTNLIKIIDWDYPIDIGWYVKKDNETTSWIKENLKP